jgi:hypothetical protein
MGTEQSAINKFALNDILTGLASGLNDAQKQLRNMAPYDEFGRPNIMYQLPYLDFQLQVNSEFEDITTTSGAALGSKTVPAIDTQGSELPIRFGAPKASFKFSTVKNSESKTTVEMKSTISGRFVATAPNEGLPQMVLLVKSNAPTAASATEYAIELEVSLGNTSGEKIKNSLIEFNYDADLSNALNGTVVPSVPKFSEAEKRTDEDGIAKVKILVKKAEYDANVRLILLVGFGTITKTISICKI